MKEVLALLEDLKRQYNAHLAGCGVRCPHIFNNEGKCDVCDVTREEALVQDVMER